MRKVVARCSLGIGAGISMLEPRRFARKRGPTVSKTETAPVPEEDDLPAAEFGFDLSGLRAGSNMAAPPSSTSLDAIRAEISTMRREAQARVEEEKMRQMRAIAAEKEATAEAEKTVRREMASRAGEEDVFSSAILASFRTLNKPAETFYRGNEVKQALSASDHLSEKAFFDDVDEVVRPKNKAITRQYMKMVFPHLVEPHARGAELQSLLNTIDAEKAKQMSLAKANMTADEETDASDATLERVVWLNTMEALDDATISAMWRHGILDAEVVEDILDEGEAVLEAGKEDNSTANDTERSEKVNPENPGSGENEEEDGTHIVRGGGLLLDERIHHLRRLQAIQEITASIQSTALGGNPTLDIAPVLQKVKRKQFDDVTEKELKLLEQYEEAAHPAMQDKLPEMRQFSITEALLDRALTPSNRLLYAMAQKDPALMDSLEGLERIKRESLLDPEFQEAVRFAHALEEESVDGHVRGAIPVPAPRRAAQGTDGVEDMDGDDDGDKASRSRSARKSLSSRRRANALRGPMARSKHAADVPYFYNSVRNIVPQRASFNLPAPALTKEEKAMLRGRSKRSRGPTRFAR